MPPQRRDAIRLQSPAATEFSHNYLPNCVLRRGNSTKSHRGMAPPMTTSRLPGMEFGVAGNVEVHAELRRLIEVGG